MMTTRTVRTMFCIPSAFFLLIAVLIVSDGTAALGQKVSGSGRANVGLSRMGREAHGIPQDDSVSFALAGAYDSGGHFADAVAVADVNRDGKPDMIVTNFSCGSPNDGCVSVLLGNGDGTFQPPAVYSSGGAGPWAVAVADVNGDGKPDILVANEWRGVTTATVGVLLGNGDGTFQPAVTYSTKGSEEMTIAVADVNGDGKPDVIVGNAYCKSLSTGCVGVLLGNGDGTFQKVKLYESGGFDAQAVAVADVNNDGKPDLVVANGANVAVLLGNGDGSFQAPVFLATGGISQNAVAIADVNGDGNPDVVLANSYEGTVEVLPGNGDGTFQAAVTYPSGGGDTVAIADVNGDGYLDIITGGGVVGVLLGNGDGTFQSVVTYGTGGTYGDWVAVADVNLDGRPDLLVVNKCAVNPGCTTDGSAAVLLNTTPSSQDPTATTVASLVNPSVYGQSAFTAQVTSSTGTPVGSVILFDGSTAVGSGTLTNGFATIAVPWLPVGTDAITAAYQGSFHFSGSTSAPVSQMVGKAHTAVSLSSSRNPATIGQTVTYSALVIGQYGGPATGAMRFEDWGALIANVELSGNRATLPVSYPTSSGHSITAMYYGDANDFSGASNTLLEQIDRFASKTVVSTSGSPSFVGQPVVFTATVTSNQGAIPDGELVTFTDYGAKIGTGSTTAGVAAVTTSLSAALRRSIKATYAGDATFAPSAGRVAQVVDKYPTTTALLSSMNPSPYGQAVTWTATVTSPGPDVPTGKAVFRDGTTFIGSATLTNGVGNLRRSLAVGSHSITVEYEGDAGSAQSTSAALEQVVQ